MACIKKEKTGHCSHAQCPFPVQSGFECIEIVAGKCEVGMNCVKECQYSFTEEDQDKIVSAQLKEIEAYFKFEEIE